MLLHRFRTDLAWNCRNRAGLTLIAMVCWTLVTIGLVAGHWRLGCVDIYYSVCIWIQTFSVLFVDLVLEVNNFNFAATCCTCGRFLNCCAVDLLLRVDKSHPLNRGHQLHIVERLYRCVWNSLGCAAACCWSRTLLKHNQTWIRYFGACVALTRYLWRWILWNIFCVIRLLWLLQNDANLTKMVVQIRAFAWLHNFNPLMQFSWPWGPSTIFGTSCRKSWRGMTVRCPLLLGSSNEIIHPDNFYLAGSMVGILTKHLATIALHSVDKFLVFVKFFRDFIELKLLLL